MGIDHHDRKEVANREAIENDKESDGAQSDHAHLEPGPSKLEVVVSWPGHKREGDLMRAVGSLPIARLGR